MRGPVIGRIDLFRNAVRVVGGDVLSTGDRTLRCPLADIAPWRTVLSPLDFQHEIRHVLLNIVRVYPCALHSSSWFWSISISPSPAWNNATITRSYASGLRPDECS